MVIVKLLHHATAVLGNGCNTSLTSANSSKTRYATAVLGNGCNTSSTLANSSKAATPPQHLQTPQRHVLPPYLMPQALSPSVFDETYVPCMCKVYCSEVYTEYNCRSESIIVSSFTSRLDESSFLDNAAQD